MADSLAPSLAGLDGAFALLSIIADPAKAKERLEEIAKASRAVSARDAAAADREAGAIKLKAEGVALAKSLDETKRATETGAADLARERTVFSEQSAATKARLDDRERKLHERELEVAQRATALTLRERQVATRATELDRRDAALDKREGSARELEVAVAARQARLAEALA